MANIFKGDSRVKNIKGEIEGDILTLTIDLTKDFGLSGSKKSTILATTSGNQPIGRDSIKLGLNLFKPV